MPFDQLYISFQMIDYKESDLYVSDCSSVIRLSLITIYTLYTSNLYSQVPNSDYPKGQIP